MSFTRKIQQGHAKVFNIAEFLGELFTSAFTGVITFWLCENAGVSPLVTAAMVGIAGHMGSRGLFMLEDWLKNKFPA